MSGPVRGRVQFRAKRPSTGRSRGRHISPGQRGIIEVIAADPDVTKSGVPLLVLAPATRRAVVGDQHKVDVGDFRPGLSGSQNLRLPASGQIRIAVEFFEEIAVHATQVRAIRLKADGDDLRCRPGVARGGVKNQAGFKRFDGI